VADLRPISRTSVARYEGENIRPLKQIARELAVGSVVEGSVQVVDGRLRVNVKLLDAASDAPVWSERYDRTLDDAFAIQNDIARQIVAAVGATLSGSERLALAAGTTANPEAYRLYLHAVDVRRRGGRRDLETAQQLYERALALDPGFALAHAKLADLHWAMYNFRFDFSPARVARQREEAEVALRLAPNLPQAHVAMALAHSLRRDYESALQELLIARKGEPNNAAIAHFIAAVYRRWGQWDEVVKAFERTTQLDPLYRNLWDDLGGVTFDHLRRYREAVNAYDRAVALEPDGQALKVRRAWVYFRWEGRLDSVRAVLSRLPDWGTVGGAGSKTLWLAQVLLMERKGDSLLALLRRADTVLGSQYLLRPRSLYSAWAYRLRGDHTAARSAFDSARVLLDSIAQETPDDHRVHAAWGLVLAGLGQQAQARVKARWLQESEMYRRDALGGTHVAEARALILAQVGDAEKALDEIERLLRMPSQLTVHSLRLDPLWDPIRDHPRFQTLLVNYGRR
jgi:serine/threonine-protein kinase